MDEAEGDAMAVPVATGLTVADVEALPEDGVVRHLIDGELFEMTPPTIRHQQVVMQVIAALLGWAADTGAQVLTAPTGVLLSERNMLEPDVLVVVSEHLDVLGERYVEGAPDLIVEVSSPSTRRLDLVRKRRQYERFGVPEFWFVDLDADRVEVYRVTDGRYGPPAVHERSAVITGSVLEGFSAAVDDLLVTPPDV